MSQPQSKDTLAPQKGQYPSSLQNQQQYYQGQQQPPTGVTNTNSSIFSSPQYPIQSTQGNQPYVGPTTQTQPSGLQLQGQQNQWQGNQPAQQNQFQQNSQNPTQVNSTYSSLQNQPVQAPLNAAQTYPSQQGGQTSQIHSNINQSGNYTQQGGYNQTSNYQQSNYNQPSTGNFNQQPTGNYNQQPTGNYNQQPTGNFNQPQTGNFSQPQPTGNLNQSNNFQNPQQPPFQQGNQPLAPFQQGNQGPIQANFNQPNQPVQPPAVDKQEPTKEADSPKKDKDKKKKEKEEKQKKQKQEKEKKQKEKKEKDKKEKEKEKEKKGDKGEKDKPAQTKGDGKLVLQQNIQEQIPKDLTGPQILAFMKKKPFTQKIGNTEFTYSILSKKQQSFLGSNTRFLYLKGNESLSYARQFSDKTTLPFTEQSQIPKAKTTYLVPQIQSVTNQQEKLVVNFGGEKKVKWEFVCPSKDCSLKWRKKIENAKNIMDQFKTSGINNYDDFIRAKEAKQQYAMSQQQNNTNNLMQMNSNYNPNFGGNSPNKNNPNQQQFNPTSNSNYQPYNQQYNPQPNYPNQNPNKPNSVLFQGPQAEKIDNFITDRSPQPRAYLNQSMSRLPIEEREGIRTDIRRNRRNWIEQLIGGQEQVQLLLQFKNYIQRIAEVIVNELYVSQDVKLYPAAQSNKDSATYVIDDIYIEVYFFNEDNLSNKHHRYRSAVQEFKNFQYLINTTKNEGILKVPLMTMFEYKGFVGMAKSNLGESRGYKNKEFYDIINRKEFQEITRISAESLLNESKCKIVSYDRPNIGGKYSTQFNKVYFVERLAEFLPLENSKEFGPNPNNTLRAELVNTEEFEDQVFRDRVKLIKPEKINSLVQSKIDEFVRVLENQENYFTSSHELAELIHLYGINIRYLGVIYKKIKLTWLKRIFQAEIAARCLKNYFRLDMQSSILQTYDQTNRKERQEERERHKVISFLNIVFGNTEPTFRLWRNLNSSAIEKYHIKIWDNQFTNINTGYLLQAIQNHFKILLTSQVVDRKVFSSTNTFDPRDFIRFDFDFNIYNLDFTNIFDQIHESLQEETLDSFQSLCEILTKQTSTRISYLDLLRSHPIHDRISQFLLNFTSPAQNSELYNKIQSKYLPHKFLYQSKFAEIKWYLKSNKQDHITRATNFIQEHVRKWLGQVHPLMIQLYRMLAEYFSEMQFYYTRALQYANDSLKLQRTLFEGDSQPIWRDYYLVGKIHFINNRGDDALTYLSKAKALVKPQKLTEYQSYGQLCLMLAKGYFGAKYYKQSYTTVRELYKIIKQERDQRSLTNIVEAVTLIKQLLEINQEHESYYKFVESDFSNIVYAFADYPSLMIQSIKMITIPYLKNVILRNSKNKVRLLNIIEEISKIKQSPNSCQAYIKAKISQGTFPKSYLHCLKEIDSVIDEILANQMIERWKSFNNLANQSILDKIGNSQINRGFDFLANMTALFNLLGQEVLEELFIMEK